MARSSIETEVGAQIRALRLRKKWSLNRLGKSSDLSRQGVHRIESGQVSAPLKTLERIAKALGVPLAALVCPEVHRS